MSNAGLTEWEADEIAAECRELRIAEAKAVNLSPRAAKRLTRLLNTLDKALDEMSGSVEVHELVDTWRGSANIRDNIREFVDWQWRKLRPVDSGHAGPGKVDLPE